MIAGNKTQTPAGGNVVRMRGAQLNEANPVGPGIKKGSYDPALTYVVTLDPNGIPQDAKEVGAGYKDGGFVGGPDAGGENTDEPTAAKGTFDEYLDRGVEKNLVDQGNTLADRIQSVVDSGDQAQADQFFQEAKDFVTAVEAAREQAMQDGDPELMRALKEMSAEAKDLQASIESILNEGQSSPATAQNNPDAAMRRAGPMMKKAVA